jgi:RNA polymerase sigma-70 factor (ECF subfamily)
LATYNGGGKFPACEISSKARNTGEAMRAATEAIQFEPADLRGDAVLGSSEKALFDNLVLPHLSEAFALARWLTGSRTEAEDVVQEACLRAYRAIGSFAGGAPRAWLLTIVRNEAYTALRKRKAALVSLEDLSLHDRAALERGGGVAVAEVPTPEVELLAKADMDQFEQAIAALPLEFREPLILRDIQGLEYREIAQITAVPIGTVMSRLARARRRVVSIIRAGE